MSLGIAAKPVHFVRRLLRDTLAIRRQLRSAAGLVGYGLDAEIPRRTFWTYSVWSDQASLDLVRRHRAPREHHPPVAAADGTDPGSDDHRDGHERRGYLGGTQAPVL